MAETELVSTLQRQLGWEADMALSVIARIKEAAIWSDSDTISDIVRDYMGDNATCRAAVQRYAVDTLSKTFGPGATRKVRNDEAEVFGSARRQAESPSSGKPPPGTTPTEGNRQSPAAAADAGARTTVASPANATSPAPRPTAPPKQASTHVATGAKAASSVERLAGKGGKGKKKGATAGLRVEQAALKALKRTVFNCLTCGKVYDCREETAEGIALMATGGACLFCAMPIPAATAACSSTANSPAVSGPPAPASAPSSDAVSAHAYKERMLEFDRTSAKRTAVIDDQGDFYEIESNAWMTPEEREQMKARQRLEEEVAKLRRDRVTVTVDLVGRTVIHHAKGSAAQDEEMGFELEKSGQRASQAAAATRSAMPEGGGTAAPAAEAAAARGRRMLRELSMAPCLAEGEAAPKFVTTGDRGKSGRGRRGGKGGKAVGGRGDRRGGEVKGVWADRQRTAARGQGSLAEDVFAQFAHDVEVLYSDTLAAEDAADEFMAASER